MRASCICTAPVMLRQGVLVCATCGAPIMSPADETYSTEPGTWPPRCRTRRAARDRIRRVPGHEREGEGPATVWRVSVDAYRAHYQRQRAPELQLVSQLSDEEIAERALRQWRTTR